MTEVTETKELNGDRIKVGGLLLNIIMVFVMIPVLATVYFIKVIVMGEKVVWTNSEFLLKSLLIYLGLYLTTLIVHLVIKYLTMKLLGMNRIKVKIKDSMLFLYSPKETTVKKARIIGILPFVVILLAFIISIFYSDIIGSMTMALVLVVTSDSLFMYLKLLKYDKESICIQEANCLGYRIIN